MKGIVKWFSRLRGYGFITADDGADVFVHYSAIDGRGYRNLAEGETVAFDVADHGRGLAARNVRTIGRYEENR